LPDITTTALGVAERGLALGKSLLERRSAGRVAMLGAAVTLAVASLLIGLPAKPAVAQPVAYVTPLPPQAGARGTTDTVPLDVPFQVQFTKPMNESTVESALTITPPIALNYRWDALSQVLSLAPDPYWQPTTDYTVEVSVNAADHEGLGLSAPIVTTFRSGPLTSGVLGATRVIGGLAAPTTTFQVTFTRPVKLATVLMRLTIDPPVDNTIQGDDPTDAASQVFTLTPKKPLATNKAYAVRLADGGTDAAGAALLPVQSFYIKTLTAPSVVKVTPQDGTYSYDPNQVISVVFSTPMDEKTGAAALSVRTNGHAVAGSTAWTQDDTVLVFTPRRSYYLGSNIQIRVAASARSAGGLTMPAAVSSSFVVTSPRNQRQIAARIKGTKIPWLGVSLPGAPWHSAEIYYLSLLNCTRTGKWVTSSGNCSTQTHHTLPAQGALRFNSAIADGVSRPYAQQLALRGVLTHYLDGTTIQSRLNAAGIYPSTWGENISSPSNPGPGGMIAAELFFQSEYWNRGGHYKNIMNPRYRSVGVGVWQASGRTRVVIDFSG
jgi:hypothetical protein